MITAFLAGVFTVIGIEALVAGLFVLWVTRVPRDTDTDDDA